MALTFRSDSATDSKLDNKVTSDFIKASISQWNQGELQMENLKPAPETQKVPPSGSLSSEIWSMGSQAFHSAGNGMQKTEKWVSEHPRAAAAIGAAAVAGTVIGAVITKGKSAEVAEIIENSLSIAKNGAKLTGLAAEAASLLSKSSALRTGLTTAGGLVPFSLVTACDHKDTAHLHKDQEVAQAHNETVAAEKDKKRA